MGNDLTSSGEDAGLVPGPPTFRPMLPTAAPSLPTDESRYAFEVKWDGVRAILTAADGTVRAMSRNARDISPAYPELAVLSDVLAGRSCVLDVELVAFDPEGRPSFETLQQRMHVREVRAVARLAVTVPVVVVIFDMLWISGDSLVARPYTERRDALASLGMGTGPTWRVPSASIGAAEPVLAVVHGSGLEGVIAKRLDGRYEPGARSRSWLKVKFQQRQEFVVGGFTVGERGRAGRIGALVLGVHDDVGRLVCAGKVGTGFTGRELDRLAGMLVPLARSDSPFSAGDVPRGSRFVEPRLVCEVRFAGWTASGAIRHPAYLGLRDDKHPGDVVREAGGRGPSE